MDTFVAWCAFVGSWLLVAGAIYQSYFELREEGFSRDRMAAMVAEATLLPAVSGWWWLVPPIKLLLDDRRRDRQKRALLDRLAPADRESVLSYVSTSRGWVVVATGALLIALNETHDLTERMELGPLAYWAISGAALGLCVLNTARARNVADRNRTGKAP